MNAIVFSLSVAAVSGALAIAACGGDVVVDDAPTGGGGSGASSSSSSTSSSPSVSSSSTGAPGVTSSSGISTSTGPCVTCGEAIVNVSIPGANVCPGTSQQLYDSLVFCLCASTCAGACSDNLCTGNNVSDACIQCVQSSCSQPFAACANDV